MNAQTDSVDTFFAVVLGRQTLLYFYPHNALIETFVEVRQLAKQTQDERKASLVVVAHIVFVGNVQLVVPRFHCFRVQFRP